LKPAPRAGFIVLSLISESATFLTLLNPFQLNIFLFICFYIYFFYYPSFSLEGI